MFTQWKFDPADPAVIAPSGLRITIREIAHWVQDRVYNRHDLTGPWAGWRVRGRFLIGPGGVKVTPEALRHMKAENQELDMEPDQKTTAGQERLRADAQERAA